MPRSEAYSVALRCTTLRCAPGSTGGQLAELVEQILTILKRAAP